MERYALRVFALLALVSLGTALECFICNSHDNEDCYDLPESKHSEFLKNCDTKDGDVKPGHNHTYTLCRKLHIFLDQDFGETNPSHDRIHRDCGYVENTKDLNLKGDGSCYYKSGYNTRSWVCSCPDDKCNGASHVTLSGALATLSAILGAMLLRGVY